MGPPLSLRTGERPLSGMLLAGKVARERFGIVGREQGHSAPVHQIETVSRNEPLHSGQSRLRQRRPVAADAEALD